MHNLDVGGTVTSNATSGRQPDTGANPPTPLLMKHMRVTSSAGTVFTDSAGNFNQAGIAGLSLCTFEYLGNFTVDGEVRVRSTLRLDAVADP